MRSSRLMLRTTAALVLRGPRCTTPRPVSITFQYACQRCFSDEKKADDDMIVTFTNNIGEKPARAITLERSEFTQEVPVCMPDMGEGKAKVIVWFKQVGDVVKRNDVLCDIETKDFTFGMTVDDEEDGIMGKIVVPANSDPINDGDVLCILLHRSHDGDDHDKVVEPSKAGDDHDTK